MRTMIAGIIGSGFIGPLHVEGLRRLGYVKVKAIADMNLAVAQEKAQALSIPDAYGDYRQLLADPEIEVVHICTPNNLHYPMVVDALNAGKHVVCEKPLAMTVQESRELVALAKEKGLVTGMNFNVRFYPLVHQVREMVRSGEIGRILAVTGSVQQDWLFKDTDYSWRVEQEYSGESRAIADVGSHWFDLIEFMTGKRVTRVCADFETFHKVRKKPLKPVETYSGKLLEAGDYEERPVKTEDYAGVTFHLEGGAHGIFHANQVAAGRKYRIYFEINGDKCSVSWDSEVPNQLWVGKRDGNNEIIFKDPSLMHPAARQIASYPGGHTEGYPDTAKQLFGKIYSYIAAGGLSSIEACDFPTFESGLHEQMLCQSIIDSVKQERWVSALEHT